MITAILRPVGIASAAIISALGLVSRKSRRARFAYHLTLYAGTLGIMSVWGVVVSVAATLIGQRFNINYIVARSFYHTASPLIGIRLRVEGEEHLAQLSSGKGPGGKAQSAVLVGNHQSFLDILYLGRIFPKRASIMAKRELIYAPLLGQYLAASGAVFVNRKSKTHALAAMAKAGEKMKRRGISLWVFPEGTRSSKPDPTLLPFKRGAFHLAVQAQVPIVPVVCENYHRLFDGMTRMDRGTLTLRVLPPIPTTGLTSDDVTTLTESTHAQMLEALIDISQPGPSSVKSTLATLASSSSSSEKGRIHPIDTSAASDVKANAEAEGEEEGSSGQDTPTSAAWSYTSAGTTGDGTDGLEGAEGQEGQGTEDEMDSEEDAVLLRRPKEPSDKSETGKDTGPSP